MKRTLVVCAITLLSLGVPVILTYAVLHTLGPQPSLGFLYLFAVMVAAWWGGYASGVIVALTSLFLLPYLFVPHFSPASVDLPRVFSTVLIAVLISRSRAVRKKREAALVTAKEAVEQRVQEQTADLARSSMALQESQTQRKQTAEQLRETHQELANILESITDGFVAVNTQWRYTYANSKAAELLRRPVEQLLGLQVWDVFPEIVGGPVEDTYRRAMEQRVRTHVEAYSEPLQRWLEQDVYPAKDGITIFTRDITERKRFADKLQQTAKLESLGLLAGGIAHDFNNLLTGILGSATLAHDSLSVAHPARRLLEDTVHASEKAAHLTKQLLAYAGKGRFVVEPLDLSALVQEVSTLIKTSIPKRVQLRLDLTPNLPCIEGDAVQLQQLLMNLVINGAEAIPEGQDGTVLVTTAVQEVDEVYLQQTFGSLELATGRYVNMEVHDTGSGMDQATVNRIFDPFFTTKFTGRGLGLAATLGIVRSHHGALKVYTAPGKGSTFKVLFPAISGVAAAAGEGACAPALHGAGTILIVDDEPIVRSVAKNALESYGYNIILAEDGRQAIDAFQRETIALVLLDMTMPGLSGEETFRQLRRLNPNVPVILSSGYNEIEAIQRFTGKGIAGFVQKPYSAATLAKKISDVLRSK